MNDETYELAWLTEERDAAIERANFLAEQASEAARVWPARVAAARADERKQITAAFGDWALKNEIATPPLDWAWFGEIMRRFDVTYGVD